MNRIMSRRVSQNIRESFGYAKKTTNEQLDREFMRLSSHIDALKCMSMRFSTYVKHLKDFHGAAGVLGKVFREAPMVDVASTRPTDRVCAAIDDYHTKFAGLIDTMVRGLERDTSHHREVFDQIFFNGANKANESEKNAIDQLSHLDLILCCLLFFRPGSTIRDADCWQN